ncbi:MAG: hypothetical protein M1554_01715 [Patescibacteria group bacterium]|nr:hypothetical protein [Patescibacteria group bacterium]
METSDHKLRVCRELFFKKPLKIKQELPKPINKNVPKSLNQISGTISWTN